LRRGMRRPALVPHGVLGAVYDLHDGRPYEVIVSCARALQASACTVWRSRVVNLQQHACLVPMSLLLWFSSAGRGNLCCGRGNPSPGLFSVCRSPPLCDLPLLNSNSPCRCKTPGWWCARRQVPPVSLQVPSPRSLGGEVQGSPLGRWICPVHS